MGRPRLSRILRTGLALALLTGCSYPDVDVSVALNRNDRIDANLAFDYGNFAEDPASLTADAREAEERAADEMRNCINGSMSGQIGRGPIRIAIRDQTEQQLRTSLECIVLGGNQNGSLADYTDVVLTVDDGFFYDTKTLTIKLNLPIGTWRGEPGKQLVIPRNFVVETQGSVDFEVTKQSPAVFLNFEKLSDSSVKVLFSADESVVESWVEREPDGTCPDRGPCRFVEPFAAQVEFQISSSVNNFGLGDILAFFSILFGSGLAVTVGSRILAVRTENKTN